MASPLEPVGADSPEALVVTLPGAQVVDDALIDQAVAHVNQVYTVKGLETVREIGEYLIGTFFQGDPEKFHSHGRKHASFRKLSERQDLRVSYATLWNACAVVDQLRLLPSEIREALPVAHHRLLLTVRDQEAKVDLARKAVEENLSKRVFEGEVKKAKKHEAGAVRLGRPPLPEFAKGITQLKTAVKRATSEDVRPEAFTVYSVTKTRALIEELEEQIDALHGLKTQIEAAMGEWERREGTRDDSVPVQ